MDEFNSGYGVTEKGTNITASITVNGTVYYIDEYKDVYEKMGDRFIAIYNQEIIDKVLSVLSRPMQGDYLE